MKLLLFYVPKEHCEEVKQAVFDAGGGRYNNYDHCCWQTEGVGQFRPLKGSDPFIGKQGQVEKVDEIKVELICKDSAIDDVVEALKGSHPYEEPAFMVLEC